MQRSFAGMRVRFIERKNGQGVWCYAEKGNPSTRSHHHGRGLANDRTHHHKNHARNDSDRIERARPPTFVFLHGFGADKDTYPNMIRHVPTSYHSVVVDLPGHGETSFVDGHDEPCIESYVTSLREFLELTRLDEAKVFLVG